MYVKAVNNLFMNDKEVFNMGFFGKLVDNALDSIKDKHDKIQVERQKLSGRSDEDLIKIVKSNSSSNNRSIAARLVLKDRGYDF